METPAEFRSRVRSANRPAFDLFGRVADLVEPAIARKRFLSGEVERAMDMLMLQGYKAHCSLYVLAVRAHIEDAATIVRRLLELAIQTIYIASPSSADEVRQRAGSYLASLWAMCPDEQRRSLPPEELRAWEAFSETHKHLLKGKDRWAPTWKEMFSSLGFSEAYDEDYSFLSSIAHGRPPTLVSDYGEAPVPVRPDRHVSLLLVYGTRYFLGIVHRWNEVFKLIDADALHSLATEAATFPARGSVSP